MTGIDGVRVDGLKVVRNARGHLMEVCSSLDSDSLAFAQVYVTFTRSGVVKAWYRHHRQIDQLALLSGRLELVLYDDRERSPTAGSVLRLDLADSAPKLVRIPTLVWHGFRAVGDTGAELIHVNSEPYREGDSDEDRLDPGSPLIPFSW